MAVNYTPIVALEMGTYKIRVLVGELMEDDQIMIVGVGECPSRGIRKGEIIHFDNALTCVKTAIKLAEDQSNIEIEAVHMVFSGGHILGCVNQGMVPIEEPEITQESIARVMEVAKAINLPEDRCALHTLAKHFYVDDQPGVVDPRGMDGSRLSVDMLVLHAFRNRVRNARKLVESGGFVKVVDTAFGGICSAMATLTPENKESGVIVIDVGGGTTDYFVYADQCVAAAGSLSVGGDHITNDISTGLRIPLVQAERLKIEAGCAMTGYVADDQVVVLRSEGGFHGKNVFLSDLHKIINARMEEILSMVRHEVMKTVAIETIGSGVLLTGGVSQLKRVTDLTSKVFGLPCKVGTPRGFTGFPLSTEGPACAAPLGMLKIGFRAMARDTQSSGLISRIKDWFQR